MQATIERVISSAGDQVFRLRAKLGKTRIGAAARRVSDRDGREQIVSELGDHLYVIKTKIENAEVGEKLAASPALSWWRHVSWANTRGAMLRRSGWIGAASCATIVLSLASLARLAAGSPPDPRQGKEWYFDLSTNKAFIGPAGLVPPFAVPGAAGESADAATAVRAHVFACGGPAAPGRKFVGFLETLTPEARDLQTHLDDEPNEAQEQVLADGHLVAKPDLKGGWVPVLSDEGQELINAARASCGQEAAGRLPPEGQLE
jgi:hypothetical protein